MGLKIVENNDKERVKVVRDLLKQDPHCPCNIIKSKDTICPCKEFREQNTVGLCHCELYQKIEI